MKYGIEYAFLLRVVELEKAYRGASFYDMPGRKVAIHKAQQEFDLSDIDVRRLCYG